MYRNASKTIHATKPIHTSYLRKLARNFRLLKKNNEPFLKDVNQLYTAEK